VRRIGRAIGIVLVLLLVAGAGRALRAEDMPPRPRVVAKKGEDYTAPSKLLKDFEKATNDAERWAVVEKLLRTLAEVEKAK